MIDWIKFLWDQIKDIPPAQWIFLAILLLLALAWAFG
jgi:hypothetical protein